jgi:hypothetical protein
VPAMHRRSGGARPAPRRHKRVVRLCSAMPEPRDRLPKEEMTMSKFLVTYIGGGMPHEPELMAQAKAAFEQWLDTAGAAVIDPEHR